jgi:glycerophosphoryl diester phosphodiesterase
VTFNRHPPLVIGHRGAAGLKPENTLASFSAALELGVDAVELDVHLVEDALVVIHDSTLDRTTNGIGRLSDCTLDTLRLLDAGGGAQIPLLEEVFDLVPPDVGINVELKGVGTGERLADFLTGRWRPEVLVSSFRRPELAAFRRRCPETNVAPLFSRWHPRIWDVAARFTAWSVNLNIKLATRKRIADAQRRGFRVLVYTVNDLDLARSLVDAGVHGIFTDHPERIRVPVLSD